MKCKLVLQLHVHSNRSHDCYISIREYVDYLKKNLKENEFAILGITDHNVLPIRIKDAMNFSTKKVLVIPGIQWKLHKTILQVLSKLCTRREILTLGDHDNLESYIQKKTNYKILKNQEILGNFKEEEFLDYISGKKNIILTIPHPRHLGVDYYGKKEIKQLKQKIDKKKISIPFFVEEKTGYDPFPRILSNYKNPYLILGGSDAHEIQSTFGTKSLFSVETSLPCKKKFVDKWHKIVQYKNPNRYKALLEEIFDVLQKENNKITIKKYYLRSTIHFLGSISRFLKRRFNNFQNNLFK